MRVFLKNIIILSFIFLPYNELLPQPEKIKNFFNDLLRNEDNLSNYIHTGALAKSERLGIIYDDVTNKFLISYDIDGLTKSKINKEKIPYEIIYNELEDNYSKAGFKVNDRIVKEFYFKDEKLISPSSYFIKDWSVKESEYFRIYLSDPSFFNDYSEMQLNNFVSVMLELLNINQEERELLKKEKIIYILCRDEEEIEKVTGFNTRGIYILAYDEIITTFNCHFHEIAHLLINFRLKNLPLYTLPFFQEGFASAAGGRGGQSRDVILDIGVFLQKSRFIPFNSVITKDEFFSEDASLTYPVAAVYNLFLLEEMGIESYLNLYLKYSGSADYVSNLSINLIQLPPVSKFISYIDNYKNRRGVEIESGENFKALIETKTGTIWESENFYKMKIRSNLLLKTTDNSENHKSKKFNEVFPGINYEGHKYLIKADSREVNVYNLYTNILMASYSTGFTADLKEVPIEDGYFLFYVRKDLFDEDINDLAATDI